jgi:uncharacterized protein RhaS with RHS repeats
MAARFYDSDTGRFLSVDPVAPAPGAVFGFSPYSYANNNPISLSDPKGLYTCAPEKYDDCVAMVEAARKYIKQAERQLSAGVKRSSMRGLLAAIGKNGGAGSHGEQIAFQFGSLGPGTFGQTEHTGENAFSVTIDIGNENSAFTSDGYQTSAEVDKAAIVAHEVQHVVDRVAGVLTGSGWTETLNRELSAFRTQAYFHEGLRMRSHFYLFNPDLNADVAEQKSKGAIVRAATEDAKLTCAERTCEGAP